MSIDLELRFEAVGSREKGAPPLEKLSDHPRVAFHDGLWYANSSSKLHTFIWAEGKWVELARHTGFYGSRVWELSALVSAGEDLLLIGNRGEVYRLLGDEWEQIHDKDDALFKTPREGSLVAHDAHAGRIVVWGGSSETGRPGNDTYAYALASKTWKRLKRSPKPERDLELAKQWTFVHPVMVFDTTLERVVRIGWHDCAVLDGELWRATAPLSLAKLGSERDRGIAHDATSGETLLIDFPKQTLLRFDLAGCSLVGRIDEPPLSNTRSNRELAYRCFEDTWAYCRQTRRLHVQNVNVAAEHYSLDLGPAFEAAAALAPRAGLDALPAAPAKKKPARKTSKKAPNKAK